MLYQLSYASPYRLFPAHTAASPGERPFKRKISTAMARSQCADTRSRTEHDPPKTQGTPRSAAHWLIPAASRLLHSCHAFFGRQQWGGSDALAGAAGCNRSRKRRGGDVVRHLQHDYRVVVPEAQPALDQLASELLHCC